MDTLNSLFVHPNILVGVGIESQRVFKRFSGEVICIENQLYETTGSFETFRLLVNASVDDSILMLHGDLYFDNKILESADFSKSFIVEDTSGNIGEREVGITSINSKASILSYGLKKKWAQIAFFTGKELSMLRQICAKIREESKSLLTFEIINSIINKGGAFRVHKPDDGFIIEIDCMKDINNENFNIK
tara:strand:- start:204 stop:773 length:570 start_codon:yes stop_codon:yes gene_type:complete